MTSSQPLVVLVAALAVAAAFGQARAAPLDADTCAKLQLEQGELERVGVEANLAKGPEWASANLPPEKVEQVRRFIELEELVVFRCRGKMLVTLPVEVEDDKTSDKATGKAKQAKSDDEDDDDDKPASAPATVPGKQETVVPKSAPPPAAKAKAPTPKADPKASEKQKTQPAKKPAEPGKAAAAPPGAAKAQAKPEPQPQGQAKKQDAAAKPPAKAAATQKAPAKAKVDDAYRPPQLPDPSLTPLGGPMERAEN